MKWFRKKYGEMSWEKIDFLCFVAKNMGGREKSVPLQRQKTNRLLIITKSQSSKRPND